MPTYDDEVKARLLERTRQMLDATVDEVMTQSVLTCDYNELVAAGARIVLENTILGVLVMRDGRPFGMLTTFDLLNLAYEEVFDPKRDFLRLKVGELIADKPLVSVPTGTRLREALNVMLDRNIRTLPVIDDGVVRGIVSMVDMMRWYRDTHNEVRTGKL